MPAPPAGEPPRLPAHLNPRGAPRRARQVVRVGSILVAAAAAAMVLVVSGSGYGLLVWSDAGIDRVDAFAATADRPAASPDGSTTFLMVGSDARTGMSKADRRRLHVGNNPSTVGRRADTMLLVHVSSRHDAVTAVSLPRDSYVTIPAHVGTDGSTVPERRNKLNAAYAVGGPSLAVATVERSTGVRIDHYVEVDFLGFEELVNAVGGVDVCTSKPLRDVQGRPAPAGGNDSGRWRDRARLRPRPQPRRARGPGPDRAPATLPGRHGLSGDQQGRPAGPTRTGALP